MTAATMTNKNVTCRSFPLFSSGLPASTLWRRSCCCCSYWWIGCCCDDCWPDFFPSLHFHLPRRGSVGKRELQNRHEPNRCFRPLEKGMAWVVQWVVQWKFNLPDWREMETTIHHASALSCTHNAKMWKYKTKALSVCCLHVKRLQRDNLQLFLTFYMK